MDNDSFARLEERVAEAIGTISRLRVERDELKERRNALRASLDELELKNQELSEELRSVRRDSVPREEFEARRHQIERRVASLLDRFEELDAPEGAKQQAG